MRSAPHGAKLRPLAILAYTTVFVVELDKTTALSDAMVSGGRDYGDKATLDFTAKRSSR